MTLAAIVSLVCCKIPSFRVTGAERTVAKNCPGEGSSVAIALSRYHATICNDQTRNLHSSFMPLSRRTNGHHNVSITTILIYYASFGFFKTRYNAQKEISYQRLFRRFVQPNEGNSKGTHVGYHRKISRFRSLHEKQRRLNSEKEERSCAECEAKKLALSKSSVLIAPYFFLICMHRMILSDTKIV